MAVYRPFRVCPVCNSKEVSFVYDIKFCLFDGHPMKEGYSIVQCEVCNFNYADTQINQKDLDIYYKDLSKYEDKNLGTGGGYTPEDKDRLLKAAVSIHNAVADKNIRILDLGCANGGLLKELKKLGFTNLTGVDPSITCVKTTIQEVGCKAYQSSAFSLNAELGGFDLIILSHVLEHILDVQALIKNLSTLLNKKGLIYVECPNAENYYKIIHAPLQEFNTEHINHFTEVSFENLFGLNGFQKVSTGDRVIKIASQQEYHVVYGFFRKDEDYHYQVKKDDLISQSLSRYIDKSEVILDAIEEELAMLVQYKTIALYGIGQLAFKLLATPALSSIKTLLFDNNSLNIGKTINGSEIIPGDKIKEEYANTIFTVVITSLIHECGIRKQIERSFEGQSKIPEIVGFKKLLTD
ncbi:MAG TPA: class I SAM-dependent methyltransferase [Segetibacter sp.]